MSEIVLHLGAHRTGTTSLQKFLQRNETILADHNVQSVTPPSSRQRPLQTLSINRNHVLISEENILGTMEESLAAAALYPNLTENLGRFSSILERANIVFLSIRELSDWWTSAISYCVKRDQELPGSETLERIAKSQRGWASVVLDIQRALPAARVVVREFEWKKDNPKQQLRQLTKWPVWNETSGVKKSHNARPTTNEIAMALVDRLDFDGLSRLAIQDSFQPFNDAQLLKIRNRYADDLEVLRSKPDIDFWENTDDFPSTNFVKSEIVEPADKPEVTTCFLHIGKTGGTFLKSIASEQDASQPSTYLGKHGDTLTSTILNFGLNRKLGFFFRDPMDRFVSGFQSRLRRGLPTYNVDWTVGEATAFSFFETANDLAEALSTDDERLKSAAHFAFGNIFHLKHGYVHYLNSAEALFYEHKQKNIRICCETVKIDAHISHVLDELGFSLPAKGNVDRNASTQIQKSALTSSAKVNLREYWQKEFLIYEACKTIARDLGFSD